MTAPNVGPGNVPNVPGAQPVSELGFAAHAARGERAWRDQIDAAFKGRANGSGIGAWAADVADMLLAAFDAIDDIVRSIIQSAISLGGAAVGVAETIVDGLVNLVKNIAGAILGGGSAAADLGLPDTFEPGPLRDIADGQNALIGKIEALEDNAGLCNLTMDRNHSVTGHMNSWMSVPFNSYVTVHKNAHHMPENRDAPVPKDRRPHRIVFEAPGAWDIHAQMCVVSPGTVDRNFEVEIRVMEQRWSWGTFGDVGAPSWHLNPVTGPATYSLTVFPDHTSRGNPQGISVRKPIVIPEFIGTESPPDHAGVTGEIVPAGYYAYVRIRSIDSASWSMIGGVQNASFSVDRKSTDTTDYGAPESPTITDPITPIPT